MPCFSFYGIFFMVSFIIFMKRSTMFVLSDVAFKGVYGGPSCVEVFCTYVGQDNLLECVVWLTVFCTFGIWVLESVCVDIDGW